MAFQEGYIIHQVPYSDSSKIIYVLTVDGISSVLIKGGRSLKNKSLGLSQPLTKIRYEASTGKLPILKQAELIDAFSQVKGDILASTYAFHVLELIYRMSTEGVEPTLYEFIEDLFKVFQRDPEFYGFLFEMKYLYTLGIAPFFTECVECGSTDRFGFDPVKGGMVCASHTTKDTVTDKDVIIALYQLYYFDLKEEPFDCNRREIRLILDIYYESHLNFKTKSRKLLKELYGY